MNKRHHPKLTVLMSVYNGMPYIRDAVRSILEQNFHDYVFLIINDGSTDGTENYLDTLDDSRLRVIHQRNLGLGAALNVGLSLIETEFIARMDADDISLPNRLSAQFEMMVSEPDLVMLGCSLAFTFDGVKYGYAPPMPTSHNQIVSVLRAGAHGISHPTIFCRTAAIQQAGGYRIQGVGQDWDLFLRMSEIGRVGNLAEVHHLMRLHQESNVWKSAEKSIRGNAYALACARYRQNGQPEPDVATFFAQWHDRPSLQRMEAFCRARSDGLYRQGVLCMLKGERLKGFCCLGMATISYPPKLIMRLRRIGMARSLRLSGHGRGTM
jgi:glycosyltransferase involved in cell wall biosynthesis